MLPDQYKYIMISVAIIPKAIMDFYTIHNLFHNQRVFAEVQKGMYHLPQAGKLTNNKLIEFLVP